MCGITGIIYKDPDRSVDLAMLRRANDTLVHRGPDDDGCYVAGNVGIAMRRLAIIDLAGGHQPIANENGDIQIVYNGELYNYLELRRQLIQNGHNFLTKSDTESILHAYEEFGLELFPYLNGMFAFAIWDARLSRLLLARDRLGIKPLFYYEDSEKFIFASEIKAILAFPDVQVSIDNHAFFDYLTFTYIPAPKTIFQEIRKLPPGYYLIYQNSSVQLRQYWNFSYQENHSLDLASATRQLEELLIDAIQIRLMSDVPLGAFLSGGIDSSTISYYICQKHLKENLHTFSIGFATRSHYNELPFSTIIAKKLGTTHHIAVVNPDMIDLLPKVVGFLDEPMSDPSAIPTYLLSQFTRQFVTVALSGDGGDELFAGYERQKVLAILNRFYRLPISWQRWLIEKIFTKIKATEQKDTLWNSAKRILMDITQGNLATYRRWVTNSNAEFLATILPEELCREYCQYAVYQIVEDCFGMTDNPINQSLNFETRFYLPDDLLVKVDRMSMAHSLEVRVPFIDYRLVEFAAQLPVHFKMRGITTKFILKNLMRPYLPKEVIHRPKQGFSPPLKEWLKNELRAFTLAILTDNNLSTRFKATGVRKICQAHYQGERDFQYQLWSLLVYNVWHNRHLESSKESA